jgi:large subunit ribosomal protein L20
MTRVKRGKISMKRRRNVLKQTKGFRFGRKSKERMAKEALLHAGKHAFHDRRKKKGNMRRLWQIKINAGARENGISYSKLIDRLKKAGVALDRKILAQLAENHPKIFSEIIKKTP